MFSAVVDHQLSAIIQSVCQHSNTMHMAAAGRLVMQLQHGLQCVELQQASCQRNVVAYVR